ncbi:MAG: UvrD-helicase domain-containing protein [Nitrospirota bacterium]
MPILEKDIDINFPHFTVLKASAGSGKTHALTQRYVQFILSEKIPRNRLKNILAITFSNNAAQEMKERILKWLKSIYFDSADKVREIFHIVSLDRERMVEKAGKLIEEIFDNYSDFQVRTIDSFMTTVFKVSAIDFGYNPDFDILMDNNFVMEYSFNAFLKNVREETQESILLEEIISSIHEYKGEDSSYLWDPSDALFREIRGIYSKLSSIGKKPMINNPSKESVLIKERIEELVELIEDKVIKSGLERRGNSSFGDILSLVRKGMYSDIMKKGLTNPPVNKPKKSNPGLQRAFEEIDQLWENLAYLIGEYAILYSRSFYSPCLKIYDVFTETIERIKRQQGKVFIEDINRYLSEYLNSDIVPDVYFRVGETVFHFLIDEFQDTSPIQWKNLFPLIENSLSQGGSILIVGDTKQAIYGFRGADYTIMKELETYNPFPSASRTLKELDINYRSCAKIVDFNERVFKGIVANNEKYEEPGKRSGLVDYHQRVKKGNEGKGHAEVIPCEKNDDEPPERQKIQELVSELYQRSYKYRDIAILTQRNEDVVKVSTWLNEKGIPFVSYSSLDIRKRKVTGEIVSLLNFLDSPTDNLSFATFILGDIFTKVLEKDPVRNIFSKGSHYQILRDSVQRAGLFSNGVNREILREFLFKHKSNSPLYKSFQQQFPNLWDRYFARLFRLSGFLPLYDLVTEVFNVFRVFKIAEEEEATLIKILEVIKDFEGEGYNNLKDFIESAIDGNGGEAAWNISIPKEIDAVSVMTIHKAKGLGFPVVIVLLYESQNKGFDYIVKENEEAVYLCKINKDISKCNADLESLYEKEKTKEIVNKLNSLYVGFTRAKEELYVIGVRNEKKKDKYPFNLLPSEEFPPSDKPTRITVTNPEITPILSITHQYKPIEFPGASEEIIKIEEKQRGEFIHRVLSFVEYIDSFGNEHAEIIKKVKDETGLEYPEDEVKKIIEVIINHDEISEYFKQKPDRDIRMEQEFSDGDGNLHRMDRLIIDKDGVTVIDYKTGSREKEEKYITQLKTYMKILREIFPDKKIKGIIAYVDLKEVRSIN